MIIHGDLDVGTTSELETTATHEITETARDNGHPSSSQGCATSNATLQVRILVVEDDCFAMEAMCLMLNYISQVKTMPGADDGYGGITVERATSGEEAWSLMSNRVFDIALIDIQLPGITGLDLASCYSRHAACQQEAVQPTVIVACSASHIDGHAASRAGVLDVLPKPVRVQQLRHLVHKWMPRAVPPSEAHATAVCRSLASSGSSAELVAATRILQVEDCPIASLAVERLFQSLGFWIDSAADGEAAMALLASPRQYALLLVDLQLPGHVSGYALSSWYREHARRNGLRPARLVAVTANPDTEGCRMFGIDRCLSKPVSAAAIALLVRQWLSGVGISPPPCHSDVQLTGSARLRGAAAIRDMVCD